MASQYESYHGMQVAKEAFLEVIMALQPARMYLRAIVPLLLIQIGRDNEAYNFIKFWLKNTPKGIEVYKDLYCYFLNTIIITVFTISHYLVNTANRFFWQN